MSEPNPIRFPGESKEYRAARLRLLTRETELRRAMEAVAAERRALPPGGVVPEDYLFEGARADGSIGPIAMSELFAPGKGTLAIYSFMFPRDRGDMRPGPTQGATARLDLAEGPCPSCTAPLDQLDGTIDHASQHLSFVVVAKAPYTRLRNFAEARGWRRLRLVSSATTSYNHDYFGEDSGGSQMPMLNVFQKDAGTLRHFWGAELLYEPADPGQDPRHVGTLEPLWNMLDLTPGGRGTEWEEQLAYGCCAPKA